MGRLCLRNVVWLMLVYFSAFSLGTPKASSRGKRLKRTVCHTAECNERAQFLLAILDNNTNPCDDFEKYVCKKWKETHQIPSDKSYYAPFSQLREALKTELKDILGNATLSYHGTFSTEHPNITHKILNAYQSCMNENISEDTSLEALRKIMSQVGVPLWPVSSTSVNIPDWTNTFTKLMTHLGLSPILYMGVDQDVKNVTSYTFQMDQHHFGIVGRNQFLNQSNEHNRNITDAYKQYIMGIANLTNNGTMNKDDLQALAKEIVDLEVQIANRTRSQEERRDYHAMYNKLSVGKLKQKFPKFPWRRFFKDVFQNISINIVQKEPVVVWEMEYYKSVLDFLNTVNRSTLHNYFGFKVVSNLGPYTSERFVHIELELEKAVSGVTKVTEKWDRCVEHLQRYAEHALGRIYVEKMFKPEAKKEMVTFVEELKKTFHKLISEKKWMDRKTKTEALKKVDTIEPKIGYADWLMNDSYLEEKYKYVQMFQKDTPYVTVAANLRKNRILTELSHLHTSYNKTTEWVTGPAVVNAFYNPGTNDILFPAAVLQSPFYKYGLPLSVNMGAIGMFIGHEVTHAFDDTGSQFNSEGQLHNWWTNNTRKAYTNLTECFVKQYGTINDSETSLLLNGINSQGENIADNGGLLGAYLAYKTLAKNSTQYPDLALPGLEHISNNQMLFISNAVVWCTNIREQALRQMIQYDTHSPPKYRIIVPMSNMPEFSRAFKCEENAPMNPQKKCRVW
ncbi:neprilysin-4-like [Ornithodoros turicata]|uniref:neprilysin-4-like n=1 Tax=Ornithodoros turicata TaxID=34597 RepID=UPI0031390E47